jgi:phosphate transport system substrate-binding protein
MVPRPEIRSLFVNVRQLIPLAALGLIAITACTAKEGGSADGTVNSDVKLTGAGSSFAYPLYARWAADYLAKTGTQVNYQSKGSGAGIRQLQEMTIDFGGTDAPMTAEEMSKAKGGAILHIPVAMGAVVLAYNLPEVSAKLKMTPAVIAGIFLGRITKWNDRQIAALNAGVRLPAADIVVVHRSDGSGTTFIWTSYLAKVSSEWAKQVGAGKEVKWPVGLGGAQNEGVSGQVKQLPGSLGYVELAFARQNKLPYAAIQNAKGKFIDPSIESVTAAAAAVAAGLPDSTDYRVSILDAAGDDAYPISSMTWAILYQNQADKAKGKELVEFLKYGLSEGQTSAKSLDYAPLPSDMVVRLLKRLDTVK